MASVRFYLDKPNSSDETTIFLRLFLNGKRYKLSSGESIHPKHWNRERQEVRKSHVNFYELNNLLKLKKIELERIALNAKANGIQITAEYLKNQFNSVKEETTNDFLRAYETFIDASIGVKQLSVTKYYQRTLKILQEYASRLSLELKFENITLGFYDGLINFLINEKQMMNNTVGNYVKHLKTFMNFASERGYNTNVAFRKFKVFKEDSQQISLTESELKSIMKVDLEGKLENTRDLFIIQCLTGLRYSDMITIKSENIKGNFLSLLTHKTRDNLIIPIVPRLIPILQKLQNQELRQISNQKMNNYLKEIGWRAGIDDPTQVIIYKGGERKEKTVPKYELIGTHTGRRTFVTLSLARGMRIDILRSLTGHRDQSSFGKYIKLTEAALFSEMMHVWSDF